MNAVSFRISGGNGTEEMSDPLLVLHVHIEVADHDDAAVGPDTLLAAAEFPRLHVPLHDVDAVLLIEGDARDLVEADHIVLAHQAPLAGACSQTSWPRSPCRPRQVGIWRDLLKEVALAGSAWPELHHVVVALDERNHAQDEHVLVRSVSASAPAR